jgi:hypothetical protein
MIFILYKSSSVLTASNAELRFKFAMSKYSFLSSALPITELNSVDKARALLPL